MPDLVRTLWLQILSRHTNHDWGFRQSYELLRRSTARALSFREGVGQYMEAMLERSDPVNLIFGQIPRGMNPRLLGAASTWLQLGACATEIDLLRKR